VGKGAQYSALQQMMHPDARRAHADASQEKRRVGTARDRSAVEVDGTTCARLCHPTAL